MSDFTKEELEIINHAIYHLATGLYGKCKKISDLLHKTQRIIENYDKQICSNCSLLREGELLEKFWDKGHWLEGGAFCGKWV